jgi:hypothetical protein
MSNRNDGENDVNRFLAEVERLRMKSTNNAPTNQGLNSVTTPTAFPKRERKPGELPNELYLETLAQDLDELIVNRSRNRYKSTVSGWFFLTFGLGDALLSANRLPTLSVWAIHSLREGLQETASASNILPWFDRFAPASVVIIQFLFLLLAASSLRRSPWGAWMGRALRATSVWTAAGTLLGPEMRGAFLKMKGNPSAP